VHGLKVGLHKGGVEVEGDLEGEPDPAVVEQVAAWTRDRFQLADPLHGVKAGAHHAGAEASPDEAGLPDPALVERISEWAGARFDLADPEPAEVQTCLYTTTADEAFVLERRGRVVVGSACSGHGFKFAPAVGERLAWLATRS
jgi:sarcosine oxidase